MIITFLLILSNCSDDRVNIGMGELELSGFFIFLSEDTIYPMLGGNGF